jgi:hypothetical protein
MDGALHRPEKSMAASTPERWRGASFQLSSFGECRERFGYGVLPRCARCPLFLPERAIRTGIREEPAPGERPQAAVRPDGFRLVPEPDFTIVTDLDFLFNPDLLTQLDGEIPDWMDLSGRGSFEDLVSLECRDGGRLDLDPGSARFP